MANDLLKEIEQLKQRLSKLESDKKDNMSLFGRSYNQVGDTNSDFLIKTKGQVKVQWGTMFIDLIKDGKINVNSKFIYKEDSVGTRDGIYVIGEGESSEIWLVVGGQQINIKGEIGNTYVSFLGKQETTSKQKYDALVNIGFLYPDITSIDSSALQNGMIYVESEQKIYFVKDGQLEEFKMSIPNPYPDQFVVSKTSEGQGAIVIQGSGTNNSLAFSNFYIYSGDDGGYIESEKDLILKSTLLQILASQVTIGGTLKVTTIESESDPSDTGGFRLYKDSEGNSVLEIDKVLERESSSSSLFPEYWLLNNCIIKSATTPDDNSDDEVQSQADEPIEVTITFTQEHSFQQGDLLVVYKKDITETSNQEEEGSPDDEDKEDPQDTNSYTAVLLEVDQVQDSSSIKVLVAGANENFTDGLVEQYAFLVKSVDGKLPIRIKDNTIDIVEYSLEEGKLVPEVKSRYGGLDDLGLEASDHGEGDPITGHGVFSDNAVFSKARYTKDAELPEDDDSSKFASTEWIRKLINSILPKGTIVAYHGEGEPPEGWKVCNGENGTPDLRNKFIRAGETESEGGQDELLLSSSNIPLMDSSTSITTNAGSYSGKKIPVLDKVEEYVFDDGGSSHYCVYTGDKAGDNGLTSIEVNNLGSLLSLSGSVGVPSEQQTPIKIEPKYYSLVFIMKIE